MKVTEINEYKPKYKLHDVIAYSVTERDGGIGRIVSIRAYLNNDDIPYYEYILENERIPIDETEITGIYKLVELNKGV